MADSIPVFAGDDWELAFRYADAAGDPVDPASLTAEFYARATTASPSTLARATTGPGAFALDLPAASTLLTPGAYGLHFVKLGSGGHRHTVGVWPVTVHSERLGDEPAPPVDVVLTDPTTGETITFVGASTAFDDAGVADGTLDFSDPDSSGLWLLGFL